MSTRAASGSRSRKARAPSRPISSPSLNRKVTGRASRTPAQPLGDLQHRRDADPVVGRARPGEGAVVMRDEQQMPALGRPDRGDEVAHPRAADVAVAAEAVAGEIVGDARLEARRARISAISRARTASPAALSTGCGRWSPRMRCQPRGGAVGVEAARRSGAGKAEQGALQRHRAEQRQGGDQQQQPPASSAPSLRPRPAHSISISARRMR